MTVEVGLSETVRLFFFLVSISVFVIALALSFWLPVSVLHLLRFGQDLCTTESECVYTRQTVLWRIVLALPAWLGAHVLFLYTVKNDSYAQRLSDFVVLCGECVLLCVFLAITWTIPTKLVWGFVYVGMAGAACYQGVYAYTWSQKLVDVQWFASTHRRIMAALLLGVALVGAISFIIYDAAAVSPHCRSNVALVTSLASVMLLTFGVYLFTYYVRPDPQNPLTHPVRPVISALFACASLWVFAVDVREQQCGVDMSTVTLYAAASVNVFVLGIWLMSVYYGITDAELEDVLYKRYMHYFASTAGFALLLACAGTRWMLPTEAQLQDNSASASINMEMQTANVWTVAWRVAAFCVTNLMFLVDCAFRWRDAYVSRPSPIALSL